MRVDMINKLNNEDGITLVELVLALTIVVLLILPIANLNGAIWRNLEYDTERIQLQQEVRKINNRLEYQVTRAHRILLIDIDNDWQAELLLDMEIGINGTEFLYDFDRFNRCLILRRRSNTTSLDEDEWDNPLYWDNVPEELTDTGIIFQDGFRPVFDTNLERNLLQVRMIFRNDTTAIPVFFDIHPRLTVINTP